MANIWYFSNSRSYGIYAFNKQKKIKTDIIQSDYNFQKLGLGNAKK